MIKTTLQKKTRMCSTGSVDRNGRKTCTYIVSVSSHLPSCAYLQKVQCEESRVYECVSGGGVGGSGERFCSTERAAVGTGGNAAPMRPAPQKERSARSFAQFSKSVR